MFLAWGSTLCCAPLRRCQGTTLVAGCEVLSWLMVGRDCCFWSKPACLCVWARHKWSMIQRPIPGHSALWKCRYVTPKEPIKQCSQNPIKQCQRVYLRLVFLLICGICSTPWVDLWLNLLHHETLMLHCTRWQHVYNFPCLFFRASLEAA